MNPRRMAGLAGVLLAGMTLAACGSSSSSSSSTTGTASAGPTTSAGASTTPSTTASTTASTSTSVSAPPTTTTSATLTSSSATSAPGNAKTAAIVVSPTQGSPQTRFKVSFTAPERTGVIGGLRRNYVVQFSSGQPRASCIADGTVAVPPSAAGAHVEATLDPARLRNSHWCAGRFDGKVVELRAPNCAAGQVCPAFVVVVGTVGRFTFRVS